MDEIRLANTNNISSRNTDNNLSVDIINSSKPLIKKDIKEVIDLYNEYREEYSKCHKYRITLTINPYCTNVLFNVCTEIVKDEGSDDCQPVYDKNYGQTVSGVFAYGKVGNVSRSYMVSNTEYSSPDDGFSYYPGYDMFDNHTLRNISFRPVMFVDTYDISSTKYCFNTLLDFMRTKNGKRIKFNPRFSLDDINNEIQTDMHLYQHSNILPFIDGASVGANLVSENGWYGFMNSTSINDNYLSQEGHVFSHTINNVGNREFIDMFPDRTRFSFIPKYNTFRYRYERNWDIFLTYPWKNFYNHNLVSNIKVINDFSQNADGNVNALSTLSSKRLKVSTNRKTMLFRSYCKHGLSMNDKIGVYLSKDYGKTYVRLPKNYTIDYIGDINGNNTEYFFGISSKTFLNDIFINEVENLFYIQTSQPKTVVLSGSITDIPDFYDSSEVVEVFRYVLTSSVLPSYEASNTFDSIPKTINDNTPLYIRVWNSTYDYMTWNDSSSSYVVSTINQQVPYTNSNTYTDIPVSKLEQYIRVKKFDYYMRISLKYKMLPNIDADEIINEQFEENGWHLRFVKVVENVDCKYYIRQFRKIPNLKYSKETLPEGIEKNEEGFLTFLEENASDDNGNMLSFDSETYRLAFSKTLYGDEVAQITFLDTIDIENLTDNLGRPVTEIYSTVVKRNKGYKQWYNMTSKSDYREIISSSEIEYSRCFGSLTTGLEYLDLDDSFDRSNKTRKLKSDMSSIGTLYRDNKEISTPLSLENWDESRNENEILESDDVFFGDVVEYNPVKCQEITLSDACFRFNTAQREVGRDGEEEDFDFTYHELLYDDYDPVTNINEEPLTNLTNAPSQRKVPFLVGEYHQWNVDKKLIEKGELLVDKGEKVEVRRHEGYFYKPHTRINLLKFSDKIYQGSHRTLTIKDCRPIMLDSMFIKVTTSTMHGVGANTILYICDGNNWIKASVCYVIDNYRFAMSPVSKDDFERNGAPYLSFVDICKGVLNGTMFLRVNNEDIPSYANRIDENLFVWRKIINPVDIPENDVLKFPLSNNTFYVDSRINLYLKRQDPDAINGLFYIGNIPDVQGQVHKKDNNVYKAENEMTC